MRPEQSIPVDAKRADWPRIVSNAFKSLSLRADALEERLAAVEAENADQAARISALENP